MGQIATLYAMNHKIKSIYFGGFFLRHHPVSLHTVSYAVNYWSKGEVQVRLEVLIQFYSNIDELQVALKLSYLLLSISELCLGKLFPALFFLELLNCSSIKRT